MTLTADLTHLPLEVRRRVVEKLGREDSAKLELAKVRQAKIADFYRRAAAPGTTKDGIGPMSLAIDHYFVSYFRRLHGENIFSDPDFIQFLKRRGEWFHVPETGTRIQSGYTGPGKLRHRKTYA